MQSFLKFNKTTKHAVDTLNWQVQAISNKCIVYEEKISWLKRQTQQKKEQKRKHAHVDVATKTINDWHEMKAQSTQIYSVQCLVWMNLWRLFYRFIRTHTISVCQYTIAVSTAHDSSYFLRIVVLHAVTASNWSCSIA